MQDCKSVVMSFMTLEELVQASTIAAIRGDVPPPTVLEDGRLFWEAHGELYELDAFLMSSGAGFTVFFDFYFRDPDVAPNVRWRRFKRTYKKLRFAFQYVQKAVRITVESKRLRGYWKGTFAPEEALAWRESRRRPELRLKAETKPSEV
jgi:hypothetical protein